MMIDDCFCLNYSYFSLPYTQLLGEASLMDYVTDQGWFSF